MAVDNKIFASGKMNTDDDLRGLPAQDYIYAYSVRFNSVNGNAGYAATNIKGNTLLPHTLPSGDNIVVGAKGFDNINKIYYFVWNESNNHRLIEYNASTDSFTNIVSSSALNLSPDMQIVHIELLDEKYLLWTDGDAIKYLDIERARTGGYGTITAKSLSFIKQPPLTPVSRPQAVDDPAGFFNNLGGNPYYFKYRWVYWDNSKSAYSPVSAIGDQRSRGNACVQTPLTSKVFDSAIQFSFDGGGNGVIGAEIIAKETDSGEWKQIASYDFVNQQIAKVVRIYVPSVDVSATVTFEITSDSGVFDITSVYRGATEAVNELKSSFDANYAGTTMRCSAVFAGDNSYLELTSTDTSEDFSVVATVETNTKAIIFTAATSVSASNTSNLFTFTSFKNAVAVDQAEAVKPFDFIPLTAEAIALANGNYAVVGNYTEGFDNVDVVGNVSTQEFGYSPTTATCTVTSPSTFVRRLQFGGTLSAGDVLYIRKMPDKQWGRTYVVSEGMSIDAFINNISYDLSFIEGDGNVTVSLASDYIDVTLGSAEFLEAYFFKRDAFFVPKQGAEYSYAIAYIDAFGRFGAANELPTNKVNIPYYYGNPTISNEYILPQIEITSTPPSWADKYAILRKKRNKVGKFLRAPLQDLSINNNGTMSIQLSVITGSYNDDFSANIDTVYAAGDLVNIFYGDVIRSFYVKEYVEADNVLIVQGSISPSTLYTPTSTSAFEVFASSSNADELYYEIAEIGDCEGGYHLRIYDTDQSQTASLPLVIRTKNNDVVFKNVLMTNPANDAFYQSTWTEFNSFNDYNPNGLGINIGTPNAVNPFAKEESYPASVRYGGGYVVGTAINNICSFEEASFDDFSLNYGPITRLDVDGSRLMVCQRLRIGYSPIFESMIIDRNDTATVGISERLINEAIYYDQEYGLTNGSSYVRWGSQKYGVDAVRGIVWRLSQNGLVPISKTAKMNSVFSQVLPGYLTNGFKILGGYDPEFSEFVMYLQSNFTISYDEISDGFRSYLPYSPEAMCCLGNKLYSFSGSQLYKHNDNATYNNFYGVQYQSAIEVVGNQNPITKKSWISISENSNSVWPATEIETSLSQESNLISSDFNNYEGTWNASFLRDSRVTPGVSNPILNGDKLKGEWIRVRLTNSDTNFVYLFAVGIKYIISPQNLS